MFNKYLFGFLTLMAGTVAQAEKLDYSYDGKKFEGLYFKSEKSNHPGIVIIHNWMGVTKETEKQAKRFHALGYNVLAADIYGAGIRPADAKAAGALAGEYKKNRSLFQQRIKIAIDTLKKQKGVDAQKIAVLGYCFGGTGAIEIARTGEPLRGVISFHGGLSSPSPSDGAKIKSAVLALHGAIDPFVPEPDLAAFEKEMNDHKVNYELIKYGGAVHSFTEEAAGTDISKGAAYNKIADERSFIRAKDFLESIFR